MALWTAEKLQKVRDIVARYHAAIAIAVFGAKSLPDDLLKDLRAAGVNVPVGGPQIIGDAFAYGQLVALLRDPALATKSPAEIADLVAARQQQLQLTPSEKAAVDVASQHAGQYVVGLGTRVAGQVMAAVTGAEANLTPERMVEIIQDKTAGNLARRETIDSLRSDLGHAMGNWTRDWQRIAMSETNNAIQEGTAATIEKQHGTDVLVSKIPRPDACPDCRRLYTRGGEPIIFKLSELRANGSNVGRKRRDWLPVIEGVHPWCGCMLVRVPPGMRWKDGELTPEALDKAMGAVDAALGIEGRFITERELRAIGDAAPDDGVCETCGAGATLVNTIQHGTVLWCRKDPSHVKRTKPLAKGQGIKLHGRLTFAGMPISIENRRGSFRHWYDPIAKEQGKTKVLFPYGYIRLTEATDGDHVDVYVGPLKTAPNVYVVHQQKKRPDGTFGGYDEPKAMLGFPSFKAAKRAYLAHYDDPRFFGGMATMTVSQFKEWVFNKETSRKSPLLHKSLADRRSSNTEATRDLIDRNPLLEKTDAKGAVPQQRAGLRRVQPAAVERLVDRGVRDAESVGDVAVRKAIAPEGEGVVDSPFSGAAVASSMLRAIHEFEVFDRVVEPVAVDVVNDLRRQQRPTEMPLHDHAVLKSLLASDVDQSVAGVPAKRANVAAGVVHEAEHSLSYSRRQTRRPMREQALVIDMRLAKGGPYIGPRGGKWADPEHTVPWQETEALTPDHEPKVGDEHEIHAKNLHPFSAVIASVDGDKVRVSQGKGGYGTEIPKESLHHFVNDLRGVVHGPPSSDERVQAVLDGKAEHLGKGDDGIAFRVGAYVVKASTTVPYQPFNPGHLTPKAAAERMVEQVKTSNAMADDGVPGIMRSEVVHNGDKAFQIKPYVEIPEKLTREQLDSVADSVNKAHAAGWVFGDEIQVGIHEGKLVHFDTGKAHRFKENEPGRPAHFGTEKDDDINALKRLFKQHGETYLTDAEKEDPTSEWEDIMMADPAKMDAAQLKEHGSKLLRHNAKILAFVKNNPDATIYDEGMIKDDTRAMMGKIKDAREKLGKSMRAPYKRSLRGAAQDDPSEVIKSAADAIEQLAASPARLGMMSWRGNEDSPRPERPANIVGITDEMGLTVKGKKKRKKERDEAKAVARASRMAPKDRFAPAKRMKGKFLKVIAPDTLKEAREESRDSATVKRQRIRDDLERRVDNKPPMDPVRIARARGES